MPGRASSSFSAQVWIQRESQWLKITAFGFARGVARPVESLSIQDKLDKVGITGLLDALQARPLGGEPVWSLFGWASHSWRHPSSRGIDAFRAVERAPRDSPRIRKTKSRVLISPGPAGSPIFDRFGLAHRSQLRQVSLLLRPPPLRRRRSATQALGMTNSR